MESTNKVFYNQQFPCENYQRQFQYDSDLQMRGFSNLPQKSVSYHQEESNQNIHRNYYENYNLDNYNNPNKPVPQYEEPSTEYKQKNFIKNNYHYKSPSGLKPSQNNEIDFLKQFKMPAPNYQYSRSSAEYGAFLNMNNQ